MVGAVRRQLRGLWWIGLIGFPMQESCHLLQDCAHVSSTAAVGQPSGSSSRHTVNMSRGHKRSTERSCICVCVCVCFLSLLSDLIGLRKFTCTGLNRSQWWVTGVSYLSVLPCYVKIQQYKYQGCRVSCITFQIVDFGFFFLEGQNAVQLLDVSRCY